LNNHEIAPKANTKVNFESATAFVRKSVECSKPIMLTGNHKGKRVTLDLGWIIIDQQWYSEKNSYLKK